MLHPSWNSADANQRGRHVGCPIPAASRSVVVHRCPARFQSCLDHIPSCENTHETPVIIHNRQPPHLQPMAYPILCINYTPYNDNLSNLHLMPIVFVSSPVLLHDMWPCCRRGRCRLRQAATVCSTLVSSSSRAADVMSVVCRTTTGESVMTSATLHAVQPSAGQRRQCAAKGHRAYTCELVPASLGE